MSINDKIKQILLTKGYSPSHFADEIGVQRSSISHILSGRNRPSFDIIQKIIKRFPDLGFEWILEDDAPSPSPFNRSSGPSNPSLRGSFLNDSATIDTISRSQSALPNRTNRTEISGIREEEFSTPFTEPITPATNTANSMSKKRVERILIFYTDGSFQEYNPS
ncbi:helix-turn-helix transcriptional regulator [Rudanella lutea]|uniref:helix-turn-helix transcriptional regulator n=1 Tax=Rudanella lutea TaxID=451374 RepID=UPI000A047843|nr:helix-turn-helix transcriptional regulator [Rudanella lutea]